MNMPLDSTKKKIALGALIATLGVGALGISTTLAAQHKNGSMNGLVNAIAQKFNLDPTAVQSVFEEQHQADRTKMEAGNVARQKSVLDQAIKDGKLTQTQVDLIIAKQAEIKNFKPDMTNKTREEMQAAMKTQKNALSQWAKDNNIPEQYLGNGHKPGFGAGPMMGRGEHKGGQGMAAHRNMATPPTNK